MLSTSATWKQLLAAGAALEARAVIAGTVYTEITAPVIRRAAMQERLCVGSVAAASLALSVRGAGSIPRSAQVAIEARLTDGDTASEWLPQGTFFIARRSRDPVTGLLSLECYDALLKANGAWTPSDGDWPRDMAAVTTELAALLGLELDARSAVPTGAPFVVSQPAAGTAIRDVLGQIAQAGGGNWIVTPENRLRLLPLVDADGDATDIPAVLGGVDAGEAVSVTGVRCTVDGITTLTGDDTGAVLDFTIAPLLAAQTAEALLGLVHRPFALRTAVCDPALELGDRVLYADGPTRALYDITATLGPAYRADLSAPQPGELSDEYPYVSAQQQAVSVLRAQVQQAADAVEALDEALTQQEIFNRLTDNGAAQGLVLYNGQLYINANYINAGRIAISFLDFNSYDDVFIIPDEHDPTTLFDGQSVEDGWIVGENSVYGGITVVGCRDAKAMRGQTVTVTATVKSDILGGGYYGNYSNGTQKGGYTGNWTAPSYAHEDSDGNLDGSTDDGAYYRFTYNFDVPENADTFYITFDTAGVRDITASSEFSRDFGIRYGNNVGMSYKGLQVGRFVVDRGGNVTASGDSIFNGNVSMKNPLGVASGGTGLSASPSLLVNLGSGSAANVMQASPRPGVTGTLPIANGGTGQTSVEDIVAGKVRDVYDGNSLTFTYGEPAYTYDKYTFLAVWDGRKLTNANKNQFATAGHTHSYLPLSGGTLTGNLTATGFNGPLTGNVTGNCSGSSGSCTGNAATASSAGLLTYTHTNEINFKGGRQARCYFNYRNADDDSTGTAQACSHYFDSYGGNNYSLSNVYAGTFHGDLDGNATNVSGTVAVGHGGTGATSAGWTALSNLGLKLTTMTLTLASQTWNTSANGMFYTNNLSVSGASKILAVTVSDFTALRTTDNVVPYIYADTAFRLMSNTKTFVNTSSSKLAVKILYV